MPSSPRTQRKRPADLTGVTKERAEKEHATELKERASELSMLQQQRDDERSTEVVDLTKKPEPGAPEAELKPIEVSRPDRTIRVVCDIEEMTFGRQIIPGVPGQSIDRAGSLQMYSFEEGRPYKVPADVADHLEALGYLY